LHYAERPGNQPVTQRGEPMTTTRRRPLRLAAVVALAAAVAFLGVRAVQVFDPDRDRAAARAVTSAPDVVTRELTGVEPGAGGRLQYRPHGWLSVLTLEGLAPLRGEERYLVFARNHRGWVLIAGVRPGADGTAQVRYGADPFPMSIFEVFVTRGVDDASVIPHGTPVIHWYDAVRAPRGAHPFDLAKGPVD